MEGYSQYCPLAKGAEVFAERWTPLILRELLRGSTTFNDLHRGVPRMSRSLLSNRLKKLENCGVVERHLRTTGTGYELTPAGRELGPVVTQLGTWAQRWYRSTFRGAELDVGVLMWDIRKVDLCPVDPGDEPKLQICTTLRTMARVWMGDLAIDTALRSGEFTIHGPRDLRRRLGSWLCLSPYAPVADARRAPQGLRGGGKRLP